MEQITQKAHKEWASRPDDQRFQTLEELKASVENRRNRARTFETRLRALSIFGERGGMTIKGGFGEAIPTHWGFGQLCSQLGAPAAYLRTLPAALAATCLTESQRKVDHVQAIQVLLNDTDDQSFLRASTSSKYARIWDYDVVAAVEKIVQRTEGRFFNPKERSGKPSGLYASDHDVFIFMIDGGSIVDGGGERDQLNRGFFAWNSETGARTFGLTTFLFRMVCGNHLIWGSEDIKTLKIRHAGRAPERFAEEALPALLTYVNSSTREIEEKIKKAKQHLIGNKDEGVYEWAMGNGFTRAETRHGLEIAQREEGGCENLWQFIQGLTAYARDLAWIDARVDLETRAGSLMELVR